MGTALHACLEHADFAALAAAKTSGTLDEAICAERDRQVAVQLTPPEIAEKLDVRRIRRFAESDAFARICAADAVLRELAFITALPASAVLAAQGSAAPEGEAAKAISNCWIIRPTAARPRPTSSPPTAPSSTCTPSPSTSALRRRR